MRPIITDYIVKSLSKSRLMPRVYLTLEQPTPFPFLSSILVDSGNPPILDERTKEYVLGQMPAKPEPPPDMLTLTITNQEFLELAAMKAPFTISLEQRDRNIIRVYF